MDRVREEVGVDEDLIGRLEGGVVLEEHAAWDLGPASYMLAVSL